MPKTSKPKPTVSLTVFLSDVRPSNDDKSTYLDVRFKCTFADHEEGICGSNISLDLDDVYRIVRLAESSHNSIVKLLVRQQEQQLLA